MKKSWCLLLLMGILCGCGNKHHEETEEESFLSAYEEQFYNLHRKEFVEWVKSHPETLDMDLSERAEQAEVQINESPDGAIRVYNWISGVERVRTGPILHNIETAKEMCVSLMACPWKRQQPEEQ